MSCATTSFATRQEALTFLEQNPDIEMFELFILDNNGVPRGKLLHRDELLAVYEGTQSGDSFLTELQQRLKASEQQREELSKQLQNVDNERESAQLARLRQENQRLKLQLKEAQASPVPRLLTDQQQWFVTGAGVALLALLCGIFASGASRKRRQWLN